MTKRPRYFVDAPHDHPDAALIEACAAHIVNLHAFNASDDVNGLDFAASPLWAAYTRTRDFIDEAVPQSMEGVLAKASAARAEATQCEGAEVWENAPAGPWAAQVVNDLMRLAGRA